MVELYKYRKSPEMVVQGWHMTHFNRKDILNTKKLCLGGFRNFPDLPRSIREILGFFREIFVVTQNHQKSSASTLDLEIFSQKLFSCKNIWMRKNMEL